MMEPNEDGWVSVVIPSAILLELVRTPTYVTWQGEQWLFCCASAMVYLGEWTRADLARQAVGKPPLDAFVDIFDGAAPASACVRGEFWHSSSGPGLLTPKARRVGPKSLATPVTFGDPLLIGNARVHWSTRRPGRIGRWVACRIVRVRWSNR
jgi:hypothetical protein